ncbi:MAG: SWIM zinc finger family protein [Oscillospiraceae bacterium]|jgi:uncharacterized Zn finger protein|nr:SWIM zinc finger family protein [Oscillospiraceae bacterium]
MSWDYYAPYVSVAERRRKAEKKIEQLRKKNKNISPVIIDGKKIALTWWGESWNKNFARYADYENRIQRGSAYVKNGFVLDLQIADEIITAQVMGSSLYKIQIRIEKLSEKQWEDIAEQASKHLDSLAELVEGKFPKGLQEIFFDIDTGLFPTPQEIKFECSCPDQYGNHMCKHIAAALYGVGNRLDSDPLLFFKLRGVNPAAMIRASIEDRAKSLLTNAKKKSNRVIADKDIGRLFGV